MRRTRFVSAVTLAAFVFVSAAGPAVAGPAGPLPATTAGASTTDGATSSPLKTSIDRAATSAAAQFPRVAERRPSEPRRFVQGGGGGGGMMMMTLLVTAASLAGTYFLVKELKKNTDTATAAAK